MTKLPPPSGGGPEKRSAMPAQPLVPDKTQQLGPSGPSLIDSEAPVIRRTPPAGQIRPASDLVLPQASTGDEPRAGATDPGDGDQPALGDNPADTPKDRRDDENNTEDVSGGEEKSQPASGKRAVNETPRQRRPSLATQRARLERFVLSGKAGNTFRGVRDGIFAQNGIDMIAEISGKEIGDIGSGYGGIAQTAYHEGIDTVITSVNPNSRSSAGRRSISEDSPLFLRWAYPDITDEEIAAAIEHHNLRVSTKFAHELSDEFPAGRFERLIDIVAVHGHMPEGFDELYELTVEQMLRVLGPGGDILVVDGFPTAVGNRSEQTGEIGMKEKVLRRMGVNYEPIIKDPDSEFKPAVGVRIFK